MNRDLTIEQRVHRVRERIATAAARAGRSPGDVTLVAVTKQVPVERISEAVGAGVTVLGENRVQEAQEKTAHLPEVEWHMIGRLQRNKARRAVELFSLIHSLDSERLGLALDRIGKENERRVTALVEVNLAKEGTKAGVAPENLAALASALSECEWLEIGGLMCIPPFDSSPQQTRSHFSTLRELASSAAGWPHPNWSMRELSMGMSHDFDVAVEEGATLVRVGSAIFGPRER